METSSWPQHRITETWIKRSHQFWIQSWDRLDATSHIHPCHEEIHWNSSINEGRQKSQADIWFWATGKSGNALEKIADSKRAMTNVFDSQKRKAVMHIRSFQNIRGNLGNRFESWPPAQWDSRIVKVALPISEVAADESAKASAHPVGSSQLIFYPI